MSMLGCKSVVDLQKVDVEELVQATGAFEMRIEPEKDGKYLPLDPYEAYADGTAKDIEIMQGCNKDELNYFVSGFGLDTYLQRGADRKAGKLAQLTDSEKKLVESFCSQHLSADISPDGKAHEWPLYDFLTGRGAIS